MGQSEYFPVSSIKPHHRSSVVNAQGPHSQTLMTGGGGRGEESDRVSYFIPKNITTSEFVYPKKSLLFLAYPKKSLSPFFATPKNSSFLWRPKKIPASFIDPKNHFWPKFQTQKNHSDPPPPVIKICEWGRWGIMIAKCQESSIAN